MNRLCIIFASVAVALLGAGVAHAGDEPKLAAKAFERSDCSIRFPEGWRAESMAGATSFVIATAATPDVRNGQEQAANLNLARVALAKVDLMAHAKDYQSRMAKDTPAQNYRAVDLPREVAINGLKAVSFGGTYTSSGKALRNRQWLIAAPGRVYIVTLTSLAAAWASHERVGEASVATFKAVDEKK